MPNVELPDYDYETSFKKSSSDERELLKLVRSKRDEAAANELLLRFSHGIIADKFVLDEIMDGCREVAGYVVNKTMLRTDGELFPVSPLMFFHGVHARPKTGKKNKLNKRFELLASFSDRELFGNNINVPLMSLSDLRDALTTRLEMASTSSAPDEGAPVRKAVMKKDWPRTVARAEEAVAAYLRWKHKREDISLAAARRYLRASFNIPDEGDFPYPQNWR